MPPTNHSLFFSTLDRLLATHADLWQTRPFHHRKLCWHNSKPDLCAALFDLDDDTLEHLENDDEALAHWLRPWLGDAGKTLQELSRLPLLPSHHLGAIPAHFSTGIPGRKWQQIQAMAAVLPRDQRPLLEWCAGKGHLGRLLAVMDGRKVTSLEVQADLCQAGAQAASQWPCEVQFVQADALDAGSARWLPHAGQAVALHACGDLHTRLVRYWAASDCHRLTLSPCCYHLTQDNEYRPLSTRAVRSSLRLDRLDLHMAGRQVITGGASAQRRRHTEMVWRLAFDEWQRTMRGEDTYLPLPSFPKSLLSQQFLDFCRWAALSRGLTPPTDLRTEKWLSRGRACFHTVRLIELVGRLFRRPLELWLVLDQVLFLEEKGARVKLGIFCERSLTPRNLVIDAQASLP